VVQDGADFINPSHLMQEARERGAGAGRGSLLKVWEAPIHLITSTREWVLKSIRVCDFKKSNLK
jgi:hypothetical protein